MFSAVHWTGSGNNGLWNDVRNWDAGRVPAATDDVVITGQAGVKLSGVAANVNSIVSNAPLTLEGNAQLNVAAESALNGGVVLVDGTLGGSGDLTVHGDTVVNGGSDFAGSGVVSFLGNVDFKLNTVNQSITVHGSKVVRLYGENNTLGGTAVSNFISLSLSPSARLELLEGADLTINNSADIRSTVQNQAPTLLLGEQSAVRVFGGFNNETTLEAKLVNNYDGALVAEIGTVSLLGGFDFNGSFVAHENATIRQVSRGESFLRINSEVSGVGTILFDWVSGGKTTIDGAYNVTGVSGFVGGEVQFTANASVLNLGAEPDLEISGATVRFDTGDQLEFENLTVTAGLLAGADRISISGQATFDSDARIGGSGILALNGLTDFDINGNGGVAIEDTRQVFINGIAEFGGTNAGNQFYCLYLSGQSKLEIAPFGMAYFNDAIFVNGSHQSQFINRGQLHISHNGGQQSSIMTPYSGEGTLRLAHGDLLMTNTVNTMSGEFRVDANSTLTFGHSVATFGPGSDIWGQGNVEFRNGTLNGGLDVAGTVHFQTGTFTVGTSATVYQAGSVLKIGGNVTFESGEEWNVTRLEMVRGGRITGTDDFNIASASAWPSGFLMSGTGSTTFNTNLTIDINMQDTSTGVIDGRHVYFNGNVTMGGVYTDLFGFYLGENSTIELAEDRTLTLNDSADILWSGRPNVARSLINHGVIVRGTVSAAGVPANAVSTINAPIVNNGLVSIPAGRELRLDGLGSTTPTLSGGTWDVAGTLSTNNVFFANNAARVFITGNGAIPAFARLVKNTGTLSLENGADLTITPNNSTASTFVNAGTLNFSSQSLLTVNGKFAQSAGSVDGNGAIYRFVADGNGAGRLLVAGTADFSSVGFESTVNIDLGGTTYDPAAGTRFNVITSEIGISGAPDSIVGDQTISGLSLVGGQDAKNIYGLVAAPAPSPVIVSSNFEYQSRLAYVIQFNTDVGASLSREDFQLVRGGSVLPNSVGTLAYDANTFTATLTFANNLANGDYTLLLNGNVTNALNVPMSGVFQDSFFVLAGDTNRDRAVNFDDLLTLAQNYGKSGQTFASGNVDRSADGVVNFDDLLILAQNYGQSLSVSSPAMTSTRSTRAMFASTVIE